MAISAAERRSSKRAHKLRNAAHTALLVLAMAIALGGAAWLVFGRAGLLAAAFILAATLLLTPQLPKEGILRLYRARRLTPAQQPGLIAILHEISRRAGLARAPALYVIPSSAPNAFAVGDRDDSAVAVTAGLVNALTPRELSGVLAHEVSHIENDDLRVMGLADAMSRVARGLSVAGFVMLGLAAAELLLAGRTDAPWLAIPILMLAPSLLALAQLALSRTREFDADHDGAEYSGDPAALASALRKVERWRGAAWQDVVGPGRAIPEPSLLRTHPPTEERVARLKALEGVVSNPPIVREPVAPPRDVMVQARRPRWRWTGVWY